MTLRQLSRDPRVARAFSEDAGFGRRRYWVELADGFETDAGGTSLSEDSIEELWESLRELVRPVRAARRNPIEGDITTNTFHTRGARGTARFERNHARKRPDWYVYLGRRTKPLLLDVSQYGAELNSFGDEWLGHVRLGSRRTEGNPELTCDLPPGALYGVPVTLAELDSTVRGYGVALGMYALVARALPPRTALLADGCIDNGSTSDQAERVWLSLERDGQVGVRGYHGTAYVRRNPDPTAEVEALYRDFSHERDRIAVALGEGYNSLQDFTDEEPCPDDDLDRVRRAGVYLLGYDPAIFKQTKRGRELREHLRAWVRWLAWMADRCEERAVAGWWVEGGGWEAPRGHGRR